MLNTWRRRWSIASNHFIKVVDLGLPADATGCRAGRWSVVEGWPVDSGHVKVHPLPVTAVVDALRAISRRSQLKGGASEGDAAAASTAAASTAATSTAALHRPLSWPA